MGRGTEVILGRSSDETRSDHTTAADFVRKQSIGDSDITGQGHGGLWAAPVVVLS